MSGFWSFVTVFSHSDIMVYSISITKKIDVRNVFKARKIDVRNVFRRWPDSISVFNDNFNF